jgi:hypothetical protein
VFRGGGGAGGRRPEKRGGSRASFLVFLENCVPMDEFQPLGNLCDFRQQIAVANRNHRPSALDYLEPPTGRGALD